jgi:hypothetical protein
MHHERDNVMTANRLHNHIIAQRNAMRASLARNDAWFNDAHSARFGHTRNVPTYTWQATPIYMSSYARYA